MTIPPFPTASAASSAEPGGEGGSQYSAGYRLAFLVLLSALYMLLPTSTFAQTATTTDPRIDQVLREVSQQFQVPGMTAAVLTDGKLIGVGATGLRKTKTDIALTVDDKMHLGSCTKAFTATLIGMLVDEGRLSWSDTIIHRLPSLQGQIDPYYHDVTIWQLLTHRGGVTPNGPYWLDKGSSAHANRLKIITAALKQKPKSLEINKFEYSNLSYVIAATMAEEVTGQSWESMVTSRIFEPLEMSAAGFGAPSTDRRTDQPWGHIVSNNRLFANQFDNAPSLGPAGRIHCSVSDWAKFVGVHLDRQCKTHKLLKPETLQHLHTSPDDSRGYGGGWLVKSLDDGSYELAHEGSNVFWMSTAILNPIQRTAILVVSNVGIEPGHTANQAAYTRLEEIFHKDSGD